MSFKFIRSTSGILNPCPKGAVVTIGNFDGVHKGHATMISQVIQRAKAENLTSVVMTFSPHPRELFQPNIRHHRIHRVDDKARQLRDLGVDVMYVQKFTKAFAGLSAVEFVEQILIKNLNTKHIIVGEDFAFGRGREGTAAGLKELAEARGVTVTIMNDIKENDARISSTLIREHLEKGEVEQANALLGYNWRVRTTFCENDYLVLQGDISRYLPIKNAVYWVEIAYTYGAEQKQAKIPLAVKDNVVKIHPVGQIPDIPEGRVLVSFLKREKNLNV